MAYELSEAFYAGLSLVDTDTLVEAKTNSETFSSLYQTTVDNFSSDFIKAVSYTHLTLPTILLV